MKSILAAAGLSLAFMGQALAKDELHLDDWDMGDIVAGDKVNLKKLDGRVVAIEYWGPN